MPEHADAIVIGAGMAGLTCAHELVAHGIDCRVFESSDKPGGRVASDDLDGFTLDRGFQVFLTAYPEARRRIDYGPLALCPFEPGALIRQGGAFHRLSDPWRRPRHLWSTATSRVGSLMDKIRIAHLRRSTTNCPLEKLYDRDEIMTIDLLRAYGFSHEMIERFFRPFLGGVFLDPELATSSRMCEFVFRMFSVGDVTLPADGMRAIPQQLAAKLPRGTLQTMAPVESLEPGQVVLDTGEQIAAQAIVVATNEPAAARLCGGRQPKRGQRVACVYFAADEPPIEEPILILNGDGRGPVNNLCVPSQVAPGYAPAGRSLVSVTALRWSDAAALVDEVRGQLSEWFGAQVASWQHLRTYEIEDALPNQVPPALSPVAKPPRVADGLYRCGDYCDTGSINGAMASGRHAAEAVVRDLGR